MQEFSYLCCVHNVVSYILSIALADKGYIIGDYKVTASAITKIHSYLDRLGS